MALSVVSIPAKPRDPRKFALETLWPARPFSLIQIIHEILIGRSLKNLIAHVLPAPEQGTLAGGFFHTAVVLIAMVQKIASGYGSHFRRRLGRAALLFALNDSRMTRPAQPRGRHQCRCPALRDSEQPNLRNHFAGPVPLLPRAPFCLRRCNGPLNGRTGRVTWRPTEPSLGASARRTNSMPGCLISRTGDWSDRIEYLPRN